MRKEFCDPAHGGGKALDDLISWPSASESHDGVCEPNYLVEMYVSHSASDTQNLEARYIEVDEYEVNDCAYSLFSNLLV